MIENLLHKEQMNKADILYCLKSSGKEYEALLNFSSEQKKKHVGNKVYLRGLIELSNNCSKDCYYCGIRKSNKKTKRYNLKDAEVLEAAKFAYENNFGSLVIQSGELQIENFSKRIEHLLKQIKSLSDNKLGITLSCGEQSEDTYKRWFDAGAHRYLLRIEASDKELYAKLHPQNDLHSFETRLKSLELLKKCGYQTGTGVMIGLPFQRLEHLANDLLFMKEFDIDMCGMGPYIEHADTPLFQYKENLLPLSERFELGMKMIALLRIMMPNINIAATTALQAIDKNGREKAIQIGANVLMPNITPGTYRDAYALYENKPLTKSSDDDCKTCIEMNLKGVENKIAYGAWGDSLHFKAKTSAKNLHSLRTGK